MRHTSKSSQENQTFWIYALLAFSNVSESKACYIGQTVNISRRLKEHYKNNRIGKSSYYLQIWAKEHKTTLHCILLSKIVGNQADASIKENVWFKLASIEGFITPNSEKWANSIIPEDYLHDYYVWPNDRIKMRMLELSEQVEKGLEIASIE